MLKLDIDSKKVPDFDRIKTVVEMLDLEVKNAEVFTTKHGYHIYIDISRIDDKQIPFIQMAMGSDYKREMLNQIRVKGRQGNPPKFWNVLFIKKYSATRDSICSLSSKENLCMLGNPLRKLLLK